MAEFKELTRSEKIRIAKRELESIIPAMGKVDKLIIHRDKLEQSIPYPYRSPSFRRFPGNKTRNVTELTITERCAFALLESKLDELKKQIEIGEDEVSRKINAILSVDTYDYAKCLFEVYVWGRSWRRVVGRSKIRWIDNACLEYYQALKLYSFTALSKRQQC